MWIIVVFIILAISVAGGLLLWLLDDTVGFVGFMFLIIFLPTVSFALGAQPEALKPGDLEVNAATLQCAPTVHDPECDLAVRNTDGSVTVFVDGETKIMPGDHVTFRAGNGSLDIQHYNVSLWWSMTPFRGDRDDYIINVPADRIAVEDVL